MAPTVQYFTKEEVAEHQSRGDLMMIIDGKVYDVTPFLEDHPGGQDILLEHGGIDATTSFEDVGHSTSARKQLDLLYVGDVVEKTDPRWKPKSKATIADKASMLLVGSITAAALAIVAYVYQRSHSSA